MRRLLFTALLVVGCARGPNISTDALPLKRVVIYRNGVGYFERSGVVDTDQVTFKMRQRMVGDFLATLAIVERGGSSVRSASFPLEILREHDEDELDSATQSMLKPWPVPPKKPKADPDRLREVVLSLDGKEHELAVGYVAETPVWRPSYRLVVQPDGKADLQAWGIVQNLSGEDWTDISLVLVAGSPIAFQSTLGDPVIPGRPIVTDTGEVIAAVPTGVTSLRERAEGGVERFGGEHEPASAPAPAPDEEAAAYDEDMDGVGDSRRDKSRPTAKTRAATGTAARPMGGARPSAPPPPPGRPLPMEAVTIEGRLGESISAPRNLSSLAAVAVEGGATRYVIPNPTTVPDENATMVLLLSQTVPGEAVFLFAPDGGVPDSSVHPFRVARFKNATKGLLERGPIAVFEQGSFLGQGLVEPLPPDGTATVPFALDRGLAVSIDRKFDQQGARLYRIEAGEIQIERDSVTRTIYSVKNGSGDPAKLLVKHPRNPSARLYRPPAGTEDEAAKGHALLPITVKAHGRAELVADERASMQQGTSWLSTLADEAVKAYLADPRADKTVQQQLAAAWKLRGAWKQAEDEHKKLVDEQAELEKASRETRLSLQAIEKNVQAGDLRVKLTKRLSDVTFRLNEITKRLIEVRMVINEQEVRFRDSIREIRLRAPLPPKE